MRNKFRFYQLFIDNLKGLWLIIEAIFLSKDEDLQGNNLPGYSPKFLWLLSITGVLFLKMSACKWWNIFENSFPFWRNLREFYWHFFPFYIICMSQTISIERYNSLALLPPRKDLLWFDLLGSFLLFLLIFWILIKILIFLRIIPCINDRKVDQDPSFLQNWMNGLQNCLESFMSSTSRNS